MGNIRPGVHVTRDEQIVSLEQSVFSQMRSVLPIMTKEKPHEPIIREVSVEEAIKELLEIERLNASHQEYQQ